MATMGRAARGGRGGGPGGPGQNGPGGRGGSMQGRGSWNRGPPGSAAYNQQRGNGTPSPGPGPNGPRASMNDVHDIKKQQEKAQPPKGFQTDTDISGASQGAQRDLQPWQADPSIPHGPPGTANGSARNGTANGGGRDSETFGQAGGKWDQFETNERLFGTKTSYQEELYTTHLNRAGADYKKREKEADRLAGEIMSGTSNNTHVQEERGIVKDWAEDEEERFSGVARNPNAYVPPGARRGVPSGGVQPRPSNVGSGPSGNVPKVNGSASPAPPPSAAAAPKGDGKKDEKTIDAATMTNIAATAMGVPGMPTPQPASLVPASVSPKPSGTLALGPSASVGTPDSTDKQASKTPADSFRQFLGTERERVEAKKQSIQKSERERQLADLKSFQSTIRIPLPMPQDILPILSKDADKQKAILEASKSTPRKPDAALAKSPDPGSSKPTPSSKKIAMSIQEIPPFKANKGLSPGAAPGTAAAKAAAPALPIVPSAKADIPIPQATSPTPSQAEATKVAAAKLNPNASKFVFKPTAAAFKPGQPSSAASSPATRPPAASPVPGPSAPAPAPAQHLNPFFKSNPPARIVVNTKDDFNPWKHAQTPPANTVGPHWPYHGRASLSVFSPPGGPSGTAGMSVATPPAGMFGIPGMDDGSSNAGDPSSPPARHNVPMGYGPNMGYGGYQYRMNMPPGQMPMQGQMFSPQPGYAPLPGQAPMSPPGHMGGGPQQPNGMPMYYQNQLAHNPQFMAPHMGYAGTPQRQSHGGGPLMPGNGPPIGGHGAPMYYQGQMQGTPHHTPQLQHSLPYNSQPPSSFHSPMSQHMQVPPPPNQPPGGGQPPPQQQQPPSQGQPGQPPTAGQQQLQPQNSGRSGGPPA